MVFDPKTHDIDVASGFAVHKDTGQIVGLSQRSSVASAVGQQYPKWVAVHESHVVRRDGVPPITPGFSDSHIDRAGVMTVMVKDAAEEAAATSPLAQPVDTTGMTEEQIEALKHFEDEAEHGTTSEPAKEGA